MYFYLLVRKNLAYIDNLTVRYMWMYICVISAWKMEYSLA